MFLAMIVFAYLCTMTRGVDLTRHNRSIVVRRNTPFIFLNTTAKPGGYLRRGTYHSRR